MPKKATHHVSDGVLAAVRGVAARDRVRADAFALAAVALVHWANLDRDATSPEERQQFTDEAYYLLGLADYLPDAVMSAMIREVRRTRLHIVRGPGGPAAIIVAYCLAVRDQRQMSFVDQTRVAEWNVTLEEARALVVGDIATAERKRGEYAVLIAREATITRLAEQVAKSLVDCATQAMETANVAVELYPELSGSFVSEVDVEERYAEQNRVYEVISADLAPRLIGAAKDAITTSLRTALITSRGGGV